MKRHLTQLLSSSTIHLFFVALLVLNGCILRDVKNQMDLIDQASFISGAIAYRSKSNNSVLVQLHKKETTGIILEQQTELTQESKYSFYTGHGTFYVFAYQDENGDHIYNENEPSSYLTENGIHPLEIIIQNKIERELPHLDMNKPLPSLDPSIISVKQSKTSQNLGKVVNLNDKIFNKEYAQLGLWRPLDFLDKVGAGLFMLQKYDSSKEIVLFVHGIEGSPRQFETIISSLDKTRYQAWVLYYPSSIRLEMISTGLVSALETLNGIHHFKKINIVAHSMGGLLTHSFLHKYDQTYSSYEVAKYMTINSPLLGIKSAATGLKFSPIIIPTWRDVAKNSDFIAALHSSPLSEDIQYTLVFSYLENENGDGVVPLSSQLSTSLQNEADYLRGFMVEHTAILKSKKFLEYFNRFIN